MSEGTAVALLWLSIMFFLLGVLLPASMGPIFFCPSLIALSAIPALCVSVFRRKGGLIRTAANAVILMCLVSALASLDSSLARQRRYTEVYRSWRLQHPTETNGDVLPGAPAR